MLSLVLVYVAAVRSKSYQVLLRICVILEFVITEDSNSCLNMHM